MNIVYTLRLGIWGGMCCVWKMDCACCKFILCCTIPHYFENWYTEFTYEVYELQNCIELEGRSSRQGRGT